MALLQTWETAVQRTVVIEVEGRAAYQKLRHKLYELRLILWAEDHPLYQTIQHFTISTQKIGENNFRLTIGPGDEAISLALRKAGILKSDPSDDFLDPTK
jgi:hypothetical protein